MFGARALTNNRVPHSCGSELMVTLNGPRKVPPLGAPLATTCKRRYHDAYSFPPRKW